MNYNSEFLENHCANVRTIKQRCTYCTARRLLSDRSYRFFFIVEQARRYLFDRRAPVLVTAINTANIGEQVARSSRVSSLSGGLREAQRFSRVILVRSRSHREREKETDSDLLSRGSLIRTLFIEPWVAFDAAESALRISQWPTQLERGKAQFPVECVFNLLDGNRVAHDSLFSLSLSLFS